MLRCVAFDLDGVVIPSEPSFALFESKYGITREQWGEFFAGSYREAMRGVADLEAILEPTLDSWNWSGSVGSFMQVWFESCQEPEPDALVLIRSLHARGVATCAATNQDLRRAAHLDSMDWFKEAFPLRFFSCRLGCMKPELAYFDSVRSRLELPAESILFLDDKPENVEGARDAGWQAAHVRKPSELGATLRRYL